MSQTDINELLERSSQTDLPILLQAKERAKRLLNDDPSAQNLAAYERASKMLEEKMQTATNLKDVKAVLVYVEESGRKVSQSKLYADIGDGLLKKQKDGSFKVKDVDRYMKRLPHLATPDKKAEDAQRLQERRDLAETRKAEAQAEKAAFEMERLKGKYVDKEQVYQELAARAVTLHQGLKTEFETKVQDIIYMVDGDPKKAQSLIQFLVDQLNAAFNTYAQTQEFEVFFQAPDDETTTEDIDE